MARGSVSLWWRSWHGAPTDPKWLLVAKAAGCVPGVVMAVAWALLDHASQAVERGCVDGFDVEVFACFSGFDQAVVESVVGAMKRKGLILPGGTLANWDKRQPKREDDSTARTAAYRGKQAAADPASPCVTQRHIASPTVCDESDARLDKIRKDKTRGEIKEVKPLSTATVGAKKRSASTPPPPDPTMAFPAVQAYRGLAKVTPAKVWRERLGEVGDLPLWTRVVEDWLGSGWNPRNVKGMIEAYRAGGVVGPVGTGSGRRTGKDALGRDLDERKWSVPEKLAEQARRDALKDAGSGGGGSDGWLGVGPVIDGVATEVSGG